MLWQNDNTIVIGKHQNTVAEINSKYVQEHDIHVVRRLSGGGAVYHDLGNINFTFIANAGDIESINLKMFCQPLVRALEKLGVHAEVSGRNDVTIDGKKFSGNSQYIKHGRIMHHGTIMFDSDLSIVGEALNVPKDKIESKGLQSVRSRITNVKPYLKEDITIEQFKALLKQYMMSDRDLEEWSFDETTMEAVRRLRDGQYATWEWNYGTSPKYQIEKKRRVDGVGGFEILMNVGEGGVITDFATKGDYFGNGDTEELRAAVIGCRAEREALLAAIRSVNLDVCYKNLTPESFADLLLT